MRHQPNQALQSLAFVSVPAHGQRHPVHRDVQPQSVGVVTATLPEHAQAIHVVGEPVKAFGEFYRTCACGARSLPSAYAADLEKWECYYLTAIRDAAKAEHLWLLRNQNAAGYRGIGR